MPQLMIKVLNDTLTNDIISFEQLDPDVWCFSELTPIVSISVVCFENDKMRHNKALN